jgi:hypothetical protein
MDERVIQKLREYVPKNTTNLVAKASLKIEETRREIIHKCRVISLYPFCTRLPIDSFSETTKRDHFHKLFACGANGAFPGVSQLSQNAAFLVSYLLADPALLVTAVIERRNFSDFEVLVMSTIPAIFGFFSSDEQLWNAYLFYREVVKRAEPADSVRILTPFFNSIATFRFLEYALDRFCHGFFLDLTLNPTGDRGSLIAIHASNLLQCFTKALPLLPHQHLKLLRYVRKSRFGPAELSDLFLIRFLFRNTAMWVRASPCDRFRPEIDRLLSAISGKPDELKRLYRVLFETKSCYSVPALFLPFSQFYLLYLFSVNDILFLAQILGTLPGGLSRDEFKDFNMRYRDTWFWCQVFPKNVRRDRSPPSAIIFPESMTLSQATLESLPPAVHDLVRLAGSFELFLENRTKLEQLNSWHEIAAAQITRLMRLHMDYIRDIHPSFIPREIRQSLLVHSIDQDLFARRRRGLLSLTGPWEALTQQYRDGRILKKMLYNRERAKSAIWAGIREILCIRESALSRALPVLLKWVVRFTSVAVKLELGSEFLCAVYGQLPSEAVLVPFVLLNGTMAQAKGVLTTEENRAWDALRAAILAIIYEHQSGMRGFEEVREAIEREAGARQ